MLMKIKIMRAYNIYHNQIKINSKPLSKETINDILKSNVINKKINDTQYKQYNVNELKIVECVLV